MTARRWETLTSPLSRTVVVLVSSISLLQLSSGLSFAKLSYLSILCLVSAWSAINLRLRRARLAVIGGTILLWPAVLVGCLMFVSAFVARSHGTDLRSWAIDVPAYGMLVAAVIIGLDLATSEHRPGSVALVLFLAGLAASATYAFDWTGRHGISSLAAGRYLFASMFLPGATFCLALAYALDGRRTLPLISLAAVELLAVAIAGTRSVIVFSVPIGIVAVAARNHQQWRIGRLVVGLALAALIAGALIWAGAVTGLLNLNVVNSRLGGLVSLVTSGNLASDPSIKIRLLQTQALQEAWLRSPWFGVGPGAQYSYSTLVTDRPVDSPMAVFARFGVIGAVALLILFVMLATSRLRRGAHWVPATALVAFIGMILAWSLVSSPLDDKGVALGLIPLIGLCGIWRRVVARESLNPAPVEEATTPRL